MSQVTQGPVIFLMGPTASGKTELAIQLADTFPSEIVSVDSALIYRGMDIGTAKPSPVLRQRHHHHLIDIKEVDESYSVGDFRDDALSLIANITAQGKVPILVGGTMLYFRALESGLATLPAADPEIRQKLEAERAQYGLKQLHQRLETVDPRSAQRIHPNDPQRLLRALEVYAITGRTMTELIATGQQTLPYKKIKLVLSPFDRKVLHRRIASRFEAMMDQGFLEEMDTLYRSDHCTADSTAMRAVGYRQLWRYLAGEEDLETAKQKAIIATRQMAKRQITWLRSQQDVMWFNSNNEIPIASIKNFLSERI